MEDILNSLGFGSPTTEMELSNFRKFYHDYEFKSNPDSVDPEKIWESLQAPKITGKDYHKRTVLAAEIVFQLHNEWSMGRLKLQKLMYLAQETTGMALHTNFLKQANGPYDPILMRSLESQFKKNHWFLYNPNEKEKYQLMKNAGGHMDWYKKYFKNELDDISYIIKTFRSLKTSQVELVATVYGCWKELIEENKSFNFDLLINKFYDWSEEKKKFSSEQVANAITWMREKRVFPQESE